MSVLHTLARAEAVAAGRAVPAATVLHRRLSARPLVLVLLTTAGEAGAPLGALAGTDRDAPELLVVPQPLDRDLRFGFFAGLAGIVLPLLDACAERTETEPATRNREETELCADALQIVVPNAATVDYLRLVGRSTRFLRTAEDPDAPYPVPAPLPLLGRWLTHYAERARTPGSSLLVAMTDLLSRHWTTGQSALEDQHLGSLLGWIDPPPGLDGAAAAARAETGRTPDGLLVSPPAGPATDPRFDNRVLAPALTRYDAARAAGSGVAAAEAAVRRLVASQLRPVWDDVWHGLDLLRALPEGAHVEERWKRDRWSFTGHRDRVVAGEPPQPRRDDAIAAAQKLAGRETAQARLAAQEALDDPLALAARRLAGEAFTGVVRDVEMAFSDGRRPMPRPLVTLDTGDLPQAEPGARVYRAVPEARSAQPADLVSVEAAPGAPGVPDAADAAVNGCRITVRLTGGMGNGKAPREGSVPAPGDRVTFTLFEHDPRGGPALPDQEATPWTHGGPPGALAVPDAPDPVTAEDHL
ncbi:hypothetical protein [Actinacidiphila acidipaludis]|uniref:Uncharacterized protein n=1 Tax=Actinacidiphila acidipaludis TaxID=2873382 RepID=A0ABS7Q8R2_9ACTN|nr:hypothetical protein [Streptomyces acidipaludis]MBY8879226.1 hypothetical protein [Streptomyces acidipaludis]